MRKRNEILKKRVEKCREELKSLGVKKQLYAFALKYPKYIGGNTKEEKEKSKFRLENLWYCRAFDETFTESLEAFVKFKETQKS